MDNPCGPHYPSRHPQHGYVKQIDVYWCVFNGGIGGDAMFLHPDGVWYDSLFDEDDKMIGDFGSFDAAEAALEAYLAKSYSEGGPDPDADE